METPVSSVMNTDFSSMRGPSERRNVEKFMSRLNIRHLPILSEAGEVEEFFALSNAPWQPELDLPVVIMAGGQGMRLRPLTQATPKPMLTIGHKPILERILDHCVSAGIRDVFLSVNYLASQIQDYFGDGSRWGLSIQYLEEVDPLGTAGPLGLLPEELAGSVLVINGDVLTEVDFRRIIEFHHVQAADATVALREFVVEVPFGVVSVEGVDVTEIVEKPSYRHFVSAGVYVLSRKIIDLVPPGRSLDMPDLIRAGMGERLPVKGFPIHEDWLDVGSFESLGEAREKHG
jgi:NDP-sugar pyrophosphorylase family protein